MSQILHPDIETKNTDVVILCGGLGTRLKERLNNCPKPMVEINGKPFLDILIEYVADYGFKRFILCAGYKGDFIKRYYENEGNRLTFVISQEGTPLGTAGAIKKAEPLIGSRIMLVLNGDSFCRLNIKELIKFHMSKQGLAAIALTAMKDSKEYGAIKLDGNQRVMSFSEKTVAEGINLVNAGIYLFDRKILKEIPSNQRLSLEYDIFPQILDKGVYGYITTEKLLDIGTPERLDAARDYFREVKR